MSYRIVSSNSTYSTANPEIVPNTPTLHATTNITISTTNLYTATYTGAAGSVVNGCMIYVVASGSGGTLTITHQEDSGTGFADTSGTATINITSLANLGWVYFRFASPFTYTTSTANKQRFRIVAASPIGTTTAAADSGGSNIMFFATNVSATTIQSTDDIFIINQNCSGTATLTTDGTQTFGSGTTTTLAAARQIGNALVIANGGIVQADTAASVTLTGKGNKLIYKGGSFLVGSSGTAYPAAYTFTYNFDENGTSGNYGIRILDGGIYKTYGALKSSATLWKAKLSSGTGTAADPAIMSASVNWSVGDYVCIGPTSDNATNYNETEYRYIITKNSATSYVWSLTAGGAEAALVNAHSTDAWVINLGRNIITKTTNTSHGFYLINESTTDGNVVAKWSNYSNVGYSGKSFVAGLYFEFIASTYADVDYCTLTNQLCHGFIWRGSRTSETFTGNVVCNSGNLTGGGGAFYLTSAGGKTIVDCFVIDNDRSAIFFESVNTVTFNRFYAIGCNQDGGSDAGTVYSPNAYNIIFYNSEFHCNRNYGFSLGSSDYQFYDCLFGTKGKNSISDIFCSTDAYTKSRFYSCYFGSDTRIFNYLNMSGGSEVAMDNVNGVTNNHIWYTNSGTGRATGAGLDDTTVRTADTLNVGLYAENGTGMVWEFQVLVRPATYVQVGGFIYENATFVADSAASVVVDLFLPDSTEADDTQIMVKTDDSSDNNSVFSVQAYYSGTVNRYATVRITASTTTSGAYAYVADIFNGTNNITNLLTWKDGKPSEIMFEQLGDARAVWQVATSTLTTLGTTGYNQASIKILNGRATAGGDTYINLAAGSSTTDQCYYENIVTIMSGPGAGQSRIIVDYDGVTKKAVVDREWQVNPTSDSFYTVTPFSGIFLANAGRSPLSGGSNYIYFNTFASDLDDSYVDSSVYISAGTGAGQIRLITDYDGFTKSATVNTVWSVNPDNTSVYKVIPAGNTVTGSLTAAALLQIQNGILGTQLTRGGTWDTFDSLAQRVIDTDIKTDSIEVETKNFGAYQF